MNNELQIYDPRRVGTIERYHAQTHVTRQTVGEHTWQVLRILTTIWPDAPQHVLLYTIYHDIAEGVVGDIPYPVKLADLKIKRQLDVAESVAVKDMQKHWGLPGCPEISPEEKVIVKGCELIDFLEYALYEKNLGNVYAKIIVDRVMPRVVALYDLKEFGEKFKEYVVLRLLYEEGWAND